MTPAALLNEARAAGVTLWLEGDALRYRGPREALAKLLPALKGHKPDILAALADPGAVTPIAELPKPRAPVNLDEAIRDACEKVGASPRRSSDPCCLPRTWRTSRRAPSTKTLRAYAQSFAEGILVGRGWSRGGAITRPWPPSPGRPRTSRKPSKSAPPSWNTTPAYRGRGRAGGRAHHGDLRPESGATYGRPCERRSRDTPSCSAQVPARAGTVDSLPFGTATVHVREGVKPGPVSGSVVITEAEIEAARKGRTVVRQGTFTGAPEVKS